MKLHFLATPLQICSQFFYHVTNFLHPVNFYFKDQAEMYTKGQFKDVLFYKEDILLNKESEYHPGEGTPTGVRAVGRVRK